MGRPIEVAPMRMKMEVIVGHELSWCGATRPGPASGPGPTASARMSQVGPLSDALPLELGRGEMNGVGQGGEQIPL